MAGLLPLVEKVSEPGADPWYEKLDMDAELIQIKVHLVARLCELAFQVADFVLYGLKIDLRLRLEGIYVAGKIEIEAISTESP